MQEKIIDFLRKKQGYISGDAMSERLGISRQALWKHIQELRDKGYDIVAVPHLGYRLVSSPDRLFAFEINRTLRTEFLGAKIHYFAELDSTMNAAMQLGAQGAAEGTLVVAESQRKGRGRLSRDWFSPKYKGIYASLILRPKILPVQASILTLIAAVSICEAINQTCGLEARIKWPNDILMHNKKLGGILTELNAEMDRIKFMVIGIGLNVNNDKKSLVSGATSLKEHKKEWINRVSLLGQILLGIEENYLVFQKKGADPIIEKWREHSLTLGKRVKVHCQRDCIEGEAVEIDSDGGLLIRKDSGIMEKVMAGDVVHCR
ncbi:MAG: biotin--[acetyl-CoA-carboxylase] ligase [Candidatus Omnitrophota bacterium]|nr:biotin--[acetyl-CoA-carboxylase] ligase [Candidatus Omnitrophota bacterium]